MRVMFKKQANAERLSGLYVGNFADQDGFNVAIADGFTALTGKDAAEHLKNDQRTGPCFEDASHFYLEVFWGKLFRMD